MSKLGCPHPYLGVESLTGPREAWYVNGYASESEITAVADAYARNVPLMEALRELGKKKNAFVLEPVSAFARYRRDLTVGKPWGLGLGRFLAISVEKEGRAGGTVFEDPAGTRYGIEAFRSREDAELAAAGGKGIVFAVRPAWSYPATEWISADPEFWRGHPSLGRQK
ncbi:MAG TPA: hypothetical protein VJ921_09515 [Vicinamibacteria bacterium]|nr:hypothetical protein [Vicinamibacteria bacterium]